ncbi:MAG: ABC transporter permease [Verrucomicrobia bacterium]|nr:ABC transporter permease [Verrucomicrobiota bacterium]
MLADLKLACRRLSQSPGFTVVALLTLAIGIGSATVIFTAVNALYFKPIPLLDRATEDRLLHATQVNRSLGFQQLGWNYADYLSLRERTTTLAGIFVHSDRTVIIAGTDLPERIFGTEISWDGFALLGIKPALGRTFTAADAALQAPEVALISHGLWQRRFGGDPTVVDTTVTMNGQPVTIIGVMPPGWRYPEVSDVWSPMRPEGEKVTTRGFYWLDGRARLKPGVSLAEAQAEAETIMGALAREFPETNRNVGIRLRPIREEAVEATGHLTLLLFGAVLFVFLIACLNVANLLLARGSARAKEFALRLALGAGRRQLLRQLLAESLVLGLAGGVGGLIVALWGGDAMIAAIPVDLPFWLRFNLDARVFGFVLALAVVGAALFGLVPALRASRVDLVAELKEGGRTADLSGPRSQQLRHGLVVAEVAIALVLLVGAGLMMRSFLHLQRVDRGYNPEKVLTFRTGFPPVMFGNDRNIPARFFAELLPRLRALPGVESAGLVSLLPGSDDVVNGYIVEGRPAATEASEAPLAAIRHADAGYFQTLQIPLLAGRWFDDALDRPDTPMVAVVDERFARRHFGRPEAALGQRIKPWGPPAQKTLAPSPGPEDPAAAHPAKAWVQIIGVAGNILHRVDRDSHRPTIYYSQSQERGNFLSIVMRTRGHPATFAEAAREATLATNPKIPIYYVSPLRDVEFRQFWHVRFFTQLFVVFGGVALLLACIGIYGVMSYNVALRTQELGLRMALGAQAGDVVIMVVQRGLKLVGLGLLSGFVAAFSLAHLLTGILHGVSPHDPPTFAIVPVLLAAVAVLACWLPSRRATLIAPASALRAE